MMDMVIEPDKIVSRWTKKQYTLSSRQACVLTFCFLIRQEVMFPWKPEAFFNYVWNLLTVPRLISWEKCSKAEANVVSLSW